MHGVAHAAYGAGQYRQAVDLWHAALREAEGNDAWRAFLLCWVGEALHSSGDDDAAVAVLLEAIAIESPEVDPADTFNARTTLVSIALRRKSASHVRKLLADNRLWLRRAGREAWAHKLDYVEAYLEENRGDWPAAVKAGLRGWERRTSRYPNYTRGSHLWLLCRTAFGIHDVDAVVRWSEAIQAGDAELEKDKTRARLCALLAARALANGGRLGAAALEQARDVLRRAQQEGVHISGRTCCARTLALGGCFSEADAALSDCDDDYDYHLCRGDLALQRARAALGQDLIDDEWHDDLPVSPSNGGDPEEALAHLYAAEQFYASAEDEARAEDERLETTYQVRRLAQRRERIAKAREAAGADEELWEQAWRHYVRTNAVKPWEYQWANAIAHRAEMIADEDPVRADQLSVQAGQHYARIIAVEPDHGGAENDWGIALAKQGRRWARAAPERAEDLYEQAVQHFARSAAIDPDDHDTENNWGLALAYHASVVANEDLERAAQLWGQAEQHYARALALEPDNSSAEFNLGLALADQASLVADEDLARAVQFWEQARQHYARAIAIKPDDHDPEYNWGCSLAYHASKVAGEDLARAEPLWEEAEHHFARAIAIKPDAHNVLGSLLVAELQRHQALERAGETERARVVAKRALDAAIQHASLVGKPSYNLACALCVNGEIDATLDVLEQLHHTGALGVDADSLAADPDFAALREHPRFQGLVAAAARDPEQT